MLTGWAAGGNAGRTCFLASDYLTAVRNMTSRYPNVRTVFVATDGADVVSALRRLDGSLTWLHLDYSPHVHNLQGTLPAVINPILKHRMGLLDRRVVVEAGLVDLFLLRDCDYFIGQFSSAFSLMALELSAAQKGFVPPYIGLDGPWQSLVN